MPNDYPDGALEPGPEPSPTELLNDLVRSGVVFDVASHTRATHGRDWWPLSIPDVASGRVPHWPGVVVFPVSTAQVRQVLIIASRHATPVTAQGGRSGVLGGAVAADGAIALDLTGLNRIIELDEISGTVNVEAGVFGPELEKYVKERGWTVGHFPQSFNLASVGGWLACRGAGQYSNRYGKIEDIVRGLTVVLANGELIELGGHGPRQAVGPDLLQLFVGSEGTLGVITRATLVLHRTAPFEQKTTFGFNTFDEGLDACRRILQRDARPAVLRLYDDTESQRVFNQSLNVLVVLDEGDRALVEATMGIVEHECYAATPLSEGLVDTWLEHRNDVSALAPLWEHGIVVDTIEMAGAWAILPVLRRRVCEALRALEPTLVVSVHQSHAYLDGACLYFSFAGRPEGDATAYYRLAWDVATRAALSSGATLSHHHGVGHNRARFVKEALGSAYPLLASLKQLLDPTNIMNPGVLGIGGEPW
jgi:alkyldihydroxyacetonephosphate synthase